MKKAQSAILANTGALKLMLAGGAVVAGILLIVNAIQKMKEEEAAAKAIRDQTDALNELESQRRERQGEIERISDRRRIYG